jgi:hypothetical protein
MEVVDWAIKTMQCITYRVKAFVGVFLPPASKKSESLNLEAGVCRTPR